MAAQEQLRTLDETLRQRDASIGSLTEERAQVLAMTEAHKSLLPLTARSTHVRSLSACAGARQRMCRRST